MSNYDATNGEQGWIMKSKLNELRLDAIRTIEEHFGVDDMLSTSCGCEYQVEENVLRSRIEV